MMLTEQHAHAIANLMHTLRPDWDKLGCIAALREVARRDPFDVALAAIRLAATPDAKTPKALGNLDGPQWSERIRPPETSRPPRIDEECRRHAGQWADSCSGCASDVAAGTVTDIADYRRDANVIELRVNECRAAIQSATATLCRHGVPIDHCNDNHETGPAVNAGRGEPTALLPPVGADDAPDEAKGWDHIADPAAGQPSNDNHETGDSA